MAFRHISLGLKRCRTFARGLEIAKSLSCRWDLAEANRNSSQVVCSICSSSCTFPRTIPPFLFYVGSEALRVLIFSVENICRFDMHMMAEQPRQLARKVETSFSLHYPETHSWHRPCKINILSPGWFHFKLSTVVPVFNTTRMSRVSLLVLVPLIILLYLAIRSPGYFGNYSINLVAFVSYTSLFIVWATFKVFIYPFALSPLRHLPEPTVGFLSLPVPR